MKGKKSISQYITRIGVLLLLSLALLLLFFDILQTYHEFDRRTERFRAEYTRQQKELIKREVLHAVSRIRHWLRKMEDRALFTIQERVNQGEELINSILTSRDCNLLPDQRQQLIIDLLKSTRFPDGEPYLVIDLDKKTLIYEPPNYFYPPDTSRKELLPGKEELLNQIILQMKTKDEGFLKFSGDSSSEQIPDKNLLLYFKKIPALNWCLCTQILINRQNGPQVELIKREISQIRFGKEGYIFVNRWNGDALVSNGQVMSGRKKLWEEFPDLKTSLIEIFQKEYQAAIKPDGDYIYYSFIKLTDPERKAPKVSFIYGIPELKWLVGAGVYLDDVEMAITKMKREFRKQLSTRVIVSIVITAFIFVVFVILLTRVARGFKNDLNLVIEFLKKAAFSHQRVDLRKFRYQEFEEIGKSANRMLEDRQKAENGLLTEKERLYITIKSIKEAVITTDEHGNVELMNAEAERLTGWSQEEARGVSIKEVFHITDRSKSKTLESPVEQVLQGKDNGIIVEETLLTSRKGEEFIISDSASPIKDRAGKIIGVVMVFRDITEKLKLEEEVEKVQKLESLGILAGGIAHDFNNMLTSLIGNIEMARFEIERGHPSYPFLTAALEAIERATGLTKQLLTFARGGEPILETVEPGALIQRVVSFNLSGSNIQVQFQIADNLWRVKADKGQLSQVIANLTINAREAMPEGGKLYVSVENLQNNAEIPAENVTGEFIKITFRDEGRGIPQEYLDKIFDPYFTTKQTGSGLGLAVVHSIIKKHYGYITVSSTPGTGTTFQIFLPAEGKSSQKTSQKEPETETVQELPPLRILVMDDDDMVRRTASHILHALGCQVVATSKGEEALEEYKKAYAAGHPFHLVILDLTVTTGMGGQETAQKILEFDPEAILLVSSGYSTDPIMANYEEFGFHGRIVKPFRLRDIRDEILRILDNLKT